MANGTVKWFNSKKGFGFIAPDIGGKDLFVHNFALERSGMTSLKDDQKVTFDCRYAVTRGTFPLTSQIWD